VLSGTINFGKNLRSITTKILTQICAKAGGIPWTIDELPLFNKKTMVCGLDVWHDTSASGCPSVAGFVATYNRSATKYWSKAVVQQHVGQEACSELK
jgi:aubergine